jgi:hypothetical protein
LRLAVAQHERSRTGQVAQRLQGAGALALLVQRDHHDHADRSRQHDGFGPIAEQEVHRARGHEQQEHRLARDPGDQRPPAGSACPGQFVGALAREAARGLAGLQPGGRLDGIRTRGHRYST